MKIYYIIDPKGKYLSANNEVKFRRLEGKEGYYFLTSPEGKGKRFYKFKNEEGNEINIELESHNIKSYRVNERHEQYISDTENDYEMVIIPLDSLVGKDNDDSLTIADIISDSFSDVVQDVITFTNLELLHNAIKKLNQEEQELLSALFLSPNSMSERKLSSLTGVPQKTINNQKNKILKKLKEFLK